MTPKPDPATIKQQIRASARAALAVMTPQQKAAESLTICEQVLRCEVYRQAKVVLLFAPLHDEPIIHPVAKDALTKGKTLLAPRVNWHDGSMTAALVQDWPADLAPDQTGLLQPLHDAYTYEPASIHFALIPGLAFTRTGVRLGRGKAFYDRFLPPIPIQRRFGACFACQMVEQIPLEPLDEAVSDVFYP